MKKFVMGLVFGLVLAMSFSVMANSKIVAQYFNPTITVDGNKVNLKSKPVTINGSTYLPMRELAETLNYNVQYDAGSKTIKLDSKGGSAVAPPTNTIQPINPPVKEPKQEIPNKNNLLTLNDLESKGLNVSMSNGITISNNKTQLNIPSHIIQQLKIDGYKLYNLTNRSPSVVFNVYYDNDDFLFEETVLRLFDM